LILHLFYSLLSYIVIVIPIHLFPAFYLLIHSHDSFLIAIRYICLHLFDSTLTYFSFTYIHLLLEYLSHFILFWWPHSFIVMLFILTHLFYYSLIDLRYIHSFWYFYSHLFVIVDDDFHGYLHIRCWFVDWHCCCCYLLIVHFILFHFPSWYSLLLWPFVTFCSFPSLHSFTYSFDTTFIHLCSFIVPDTVIVIWRDWPHGHWLFWLIIISPLWPQSLNHYSVVLFSIWLTGDCYSLFWPIPSYSFILTYGTFVPYCCDYLLFIDIHLLTLILLCLLLFGIHRIRWWLTLMMIFIAFILCTFILFDVVHCDHSIHIVIIVIQSVLHLVFLWWPIDYCNHLHCYYSVFICCYSDLIAVDALIYSFICCDHIPLHLLLIFTLFITLIHSFICYYIHCVRYIHSLRYIYSFIQIHCLFHSLMLHLLFILCCTFDIVVYSFLIIINSFYSYSYILRCIHCFVTFRYFICILFIWYLHLFYILPFSVPLYIHIHSVCCSFVVLYILFTFYTISDDTHLYSQYSIDDLFIIVFIVGPI